ncbi:ATP synthase subunit I [Caldimonas caldifontis]|uniref:ATP synthase subunit I n=1 Tax=Caldimonas caldifontis TaxID=1452508 RepID=A0A2S5SR20_9BURK|nr:ATP synthase subunit I [Caldimonas caldifontis]PPE65156.1 ATP synthase subunit I [Caldimonas caldifontis]
MPERTPNGHAQAQEAQPAPQAHDPQGHWRDDWKQEDADEAEHFKPLTREQASVLRAKHPPLSPWRVVMAQAVAGLVVAALAWLVTGKGETVVSALIGAAVVVVPGALLARGMTGAPGANPGTVVLRFMVWELVKIVVAVAMLVAAARLVPNLSWLAVLAAMVVCLKVNGAALLWRGRVKQTQTVAAGDR